MTLTTGWSAPAAGEALMAMAGAASHHASYGFSLKRLDDLHGLTDSAGHRLRFTQTHRLHARHPAAQRWRAVPRRAALSGAQRPEMTADTRPPSPPPPKRNSSNRPPPRCSIRHVSPAHRIWPDVPFSENDAAKAAGARTDPVSSVNEGQGA